MADFLYITLEKNMPSVRPVYWWPMIFAGMRRASFQFHDPRQAGKDGSYFTSNDIRCTFQALWDALYLHHENPLVAFWFASQNVAPFYCEVSVHEKANNGWQIDLTIEDGQLRQGEAKEIFGAFLRAGLALYELCAPCSITMYWDEEVSVYQLMRTRSVTRQEPLEPCVFASKKLSWQEVACLSENRIFVANPMPIHSGGEEPFQFFSLFPREF